MFVNQAETNLCFPIQRLMQRDFRKVLAHSLYFYFPAAERGNAEMRNLISQSLSRAGNDDDHIDLHVVFL